MTRPARLSSIVALLHRRAEEIAAILIVAMFSCFILQITFRYVFNYPLAWTEEVSLLTWIWAVLWGAVFVVREEHEIRFDIIYSSVSPGTRRIFTIITSITLVVVYIWSLPAVADYVAFMKAERSASLRIRLDYLYSIYIVFMVGSIARYAWLGWRAIRGHAPGVEIGGGSAL